MVDRNGLTEEEYLQSYNSDAWKKPSLTADICIISKDDNGEKILLIKRGNHPCLGKWALPGGFSNEGERIEETAARELQEETGIKMQADELLLVGVYSKPGRDPRDWTVSVAYMAVVDASEIEVLAADDAADAKWFDIIIDPDTITLRSGEEQIDINNLAFDHNEILSDAIGCNDAIGSAG